MSTLTAEQRGDLAESMLPVAATMTLLVHGDGGPEDVQEVLAELDDTQRAALIVVLAGLVDPEQMLSKALGWVEFDETGALAVPQWDEKRTVRDLAEEQELAEDPDYVDPVAVRRYLAGSRVPYLQIVHDLGPLSVEDNASHRASSPLPGAPRAVPGPYRAVPGRTGVGRGYPRGSLGRPSARSAMIVRWISSEPP